MKTYAYELSPEDQKDLFSWSWYHDPRQKFTRILAGPLCLILAVLCIIFQVGWVYLAASVVLIVVGLYYVFQPWIVYRQSGRSGLKASLMVASDEFRYEDEKGRTVVPRTMIKTISVRDEYLVLGVKTDKLRYFTFDLRRIADKEEFLEKLNRMA